VEAIRAGAGVPDLAVRLLRIFPWSFGAATATAYRVGNALQSLDSGPADDRDPLAPDLGVVYRSEVIMPDGTAEPAPGRAVLDALPGARAPHAWARPGPPDLHPGSVRRSAERC
jgi:hypothetical protein